MESSNDFRRTGFWAGESKPQAEAEEVRFDGCGLLAFPKAHPLSSWTLAHFPSSVSVSELLFGLGPRAEEQVWICFGPSTHESTFSHLPKAYRLTFQFPLVGMGALFWLF